MSFKTPTWRARWQSLLADWPLGQLALLWLSGLYLRLTLLVAPPLAPFMADELGLNVTGMGALTTLPILMLAVAAVAGAWVISRLGPQRTAALCLALIAIASAGRAGANDLAWLFTATAIMGIGIAALQPTLPALVRHWMPGRIALATAIYMNGMLMGEVFSAGFTLPLVMPLVGDSWRWAMVVWSLPALLVGTLVLVQGRSQRIVSGQRFTRGRWVPDFRSPVVWYLGCILGGSASLFFGINAYMSNILEQRGEAEHLGRALLWFNTAQVAASLVALRVAGPWLGRAGPIIGLTLVCLLGTVLFGYTSSWLAVSSAFAVSMAAGIVLILMVSLPAAMVSKAETAPTAAGMFTIGYGLAFVVPLISGLLVDLTGIAVLALWPLILMAALSLLVCPPLARAYEQAIAARADETQP